MEKLTTCPLCEASCGLRVVVKNGNVEKISPDPDDVLSQGHMCTKALALADLHNDPDRLRQPMRQTSGQWEPISWEEAFEEAGERFAALRNRHGHSAMGVYVGNPTVHNHEALLMGVALLGALGTRNRYSATSLDQAPQMFAAMHMFGHQLMFPVPDLDHTRHLVILGANPAASNGSLMTAPGVIRRLKAIQKRGGKVVVIDPRETETARIADQHHFIRPGSDALLLLGMLHTVFDQDLADPGRLAPLLSGLDTLKAICAEFPPERVSGATGISPETIRALAVELATTERAAFYARVGICTQRHGSLGAWLHYAFTAVTGNLDRVGGMMFTTPAFDLVGLAGLIGQTGSHGAWHSRVSGRPEFAGEQPVAVLAEEIETPGKGQLRGLLTVAGNPVLSAPNGKRIDQALDQLDFMVSVDMYINETSRHADLILPPISALQRPYFNLALGFVGVRNWAKFAPPVLPRANGELSDGEILIGLARAIVSRDRKNPVDRLVSSAKAVGLSALDRLGPGRLLDLALRLGPWGRLRGRGKNGSGLSLKRLSQHPHGIDLGPLEPVLPSRLHTADKTIHLAPEPLVAELARQTQSLLQLADDDLVLIGRRHIRSNNSWMHNSDQLSRGHSRRCTLLIHPEDADQRGIDDGTEVIVTSRTGEVTIAAEVSEEVMPGVVSIPHGWGHDREGVELSVAREVGGVSVNDLTDETFVDGPTGTAGFNGVPVEIAPA